MPDPFLQKTNEEEWSLQSEMGYGPRANPVGGFSLLTVTTKMVCFSWGIPYEQTCPGNKASVKKARGLCKLCYAAGGNYLYPNVISTMGKRRELSRNTDKFIATMLDALKRPWSYAHLSSELPPDVRQFYKTHMPGKFFRIHDSGDFWAPQYIDAWTEIVHARQDLNFWAPTRAWASPVSWKSPVDGKTYTRKAMFAALERLAAEENIVVRPSMLAFDDYPELVKEMGVQGFSAPSGALTLWDVNKTVKGEKHSFKPVVPKSEISADESWWREAFICPMSKHASARFNCQNAVGPDGNTPCRACWTNPELRVVYPTH
jgi:hypothetical protein